MVHWYTEQQTNSLKLSFKIKSTLHKEKTPYQELQVIETHEYGPMLILDGMVQTCLGDEFVYHEMITHVPLSVHPEPSHIAIVGGGDGGAVREALKWDTVKSITLIEIDERVVAASLKYLPEISAGLKDPRVTIRIEDGINHMKNSYKEYNVIIVDSTEPVGAAIGLFSSSFYKNAYQSLRPQGILVAQTESPWVNQSIIKTAYEGMRASFAQVHLYSAPIPTYPSGLWSFIVGSKCYDPRTPLSVISAGNTKYYSPQIHKAAFVLPPFIKELLT